MSQLPPYRTSLRLTQKQRELIDDLCRSDGGKVTMNTWIAKAVEEKIQRDTQPGQDQAIRFARPGRRFYEFFAGGGMARAGLGPNWDCLFANDISPMKSRVYRDNWNGGLDLLVQDVNTVTSEQLPEQADLVWASFPCQDLSLAGAYKGIGRALDAHQTRSGTFWPFWGLMQNLMDEGRAPTVIVLENVYGVLTSNQGQDFAAIGSVLAEAGYRFGAMVIDACYFVPQSRPRVFIVAVRTQVDIAPSLMSPGPVEPWHPARMVSAYAGLCPAAQKLWVWWALPMPWTPVNTFTAIIEENPQGVTWDSAEKTQQLLGMMSPTNLAKVRAVQKSGQRKVGGLYKRTRLDEQGHKVQRAEVRFDDLAGCLRTPAGGSSRQSILLVEGDTIRSRLLSPREAARLMGLDDSYQLPGNYNDAYHVAGDGVAVPVVRHLAHCLFEPILA